MPIYEYECQKCGEVVEVLIRVGGTPDLVCCKCRGKKFERKFSTFGVSGSRSSRSGSSPGTGFT